MTESRPHFVSASARGELCGMCYREGAGKRVEAAHKVGEEIPDDAPFRGHNMTQYVCCNHFTQIMGPATVSWRGCKPYLIGEEL